MKKLLIIMLAVHVITSCSDEIDLAPISDPSAANFYRNASDMEAAVAGAYDALQTIGQYAHSYPFLMEVRSDNSYEPDIGGSGGIFYRIDVFDLNPGNSVLENAWRDGYAGIQRANIVLNRIDAIEDMTAATKSIRTGEMKFLRALTYFNLVRIFGDVPLVLEEITDPNASFAAGRTASTQIYSQIVQDLTDAVAALPATQSETGRATQGAANTLLGKVHLTFGNTSEAITALRAVSGYSLETNYSDVFGVTNENNGESIFEVQFTAGSGSAIEANGLGNGEGEGSPFPNLFAPVGGSNLIGGGQTLSNNAATQELFDSYDVTDARRDVNIGNFSGALYPAKLLGTAVGDLDSDVNSIVLRYADVVLMLAEALNDQGYVANGEAFGLINQVRNRAGLADLTSATVTDQAAFALAVENERRWELAFENHRWLDLVRTGRAETVMNAHGAVQAAPNNFSMSAHQLIYPVPQREIDTNPDVIGQNTGY
ncbi:MAG: RagB/SusD family nutrient uptake outer membrane protein [Reichenbachiella sp.]|uniref:RagB/SusD family nutrient uptake outer membrane protein n=1 Tax=Reichenbachiella sp. TaxID=2184521 RepID=UPI0032678DAB